MAANSNLETPPRTAEGSANPIPNRYDKLKEIYAKHSSAAKTRPEEPVCDRQEKCAQCSVVEKRLARLEETSAEILTSVAHLDGRFEEKLVEFLEAVIGNRDQDRTAYSTAEFAAKLVKDKIKQHVTARTVRKWCCEGASKRRIGPAEEESTGNT